MTNIEAARAIAGSPDIVTEAAAAGRLAGASSRASETMLAYRPDIDGLRALAVLGVVANHAFASLAPGGFAGVDIFFVLSGFLISGIILRQLQASRFSFADFYAHRVRRIFPALALVLVVAAAMAFALLPPSDLMHFSRTLLGGVGFYANFTAASDNYFQALGAYHLLLHLWSLGVEEQFYLFWPLLLWTVWRVAPRLLPAVIAASLALSLADELARTQADATKAFYYPDSRLWELALGGLLAVAGARPGADRDAGAEALSLLGTGGLLASVFLVSDRVVWPGWWVLLPTCATAAVIAAGPQALFNRKLFAAPPMVAIGKVSYPWYLWHWPLLVAARMVSWPVPQHFVELAAVVVSLGLAAATYRWLERPIRFGMRGAWRTRGPALAMLVPALLAALFLAGKGYPERFPPALRQILDAREADQNALRHTAYDSCFDASETATKIAPAQCVDPALSLADKRPLVMLWGDSHARALYPGLRFLQQARRDFRLGFFAKGSCPFFAAAGRTQTSGGCAAFNTQVRREVVQAHPQTLILDAFWADPDYRVNGAFDAESIRTAVLSLEAAGVRQIVIVGTVPIWRFPEPTVVAREWRRHSGRIPAYSADGLDPVTFETDAELQKALAGTRARFVPLLGSLCRDKGCLLMADRRSPLQLDGWHLTVAGSKRASAIIAPALLSTLVQR